MSPEYEALREKVARAIVRADEQNGGGPWEWHLQQGKHAMAPIYDRADAALRVVAEALREPSEAMKARGSSALVLWVAPAMHVGDAWRAMLAAHPIMEAPRDE